MPRIYTQIISKGKYLFPYPYNQFLVIASRKVGASYGTGKKRIPSKDNARCIKTYTTGRMAGRMDHLYPICTDFNFLPVKKCPLRREAQSGRIQPVYPYRGLYNALEFFRRA